MSLIYVSYELAAAHLSDMARRTVMVYAVGRRGRPQSEYSVPHRDGPIVTCGPTTAVFGTGTTTLQTKRRSCAPLSPVPTVEGDLKGYSIE